CWCRAAWASAASPSCWSATPAWAWIPPCCCSPCWCRWWPACCSANCWCPPEDLYETKTDRNRPASRCECRHDREPARPVCPLSRLRTRRRAMDGPVLRSEEEGWGEGTRSRKPACESPQKTPTSWSAFSFEGVQHQSDQQILFLLAGLQRLIEPARALAAAGPGLLGIRRVAVFRGHGAAAAALAAGAAEDVVEAVTFGLDQGVDLFAQLDHLFLAQFMLARLRLADQVIELIVVEILDIDGHRRLPER